MFISLLAVMRKELQQAFRDRRMAAILVIAPLLQLIVLGYAVDLDVDRIPTVVCDLDDTTESRELAAAFFAGGTFRKVAETRDPERASQMLERGEAATAIVLPTAMARDLDRRSSTTIQVLVDGTDPNRAQIAANAASSFLTDRSMGIAVRMIQGDMAAVGRTVQPSPPRLVPRVLYNPRLRSATYMVPGVAAMVLLIVTTVVTAMGIAREREIGTLEQILVTPLRPAVLLVGKCLPFAFVGLIEVAAIVTIGSYLFEVPIRGSLLIIFAATLVYLLSTLGTGVFISTISSSQQQAILVGFFFMMPAILLSGFMTPIENMPSWIRPLTLVNPVRYYLEILRSCLLRGAGFRELWPQFVALGAFGSTILTISSLRFRKRLG